MHLAYSNKPILENKRADLTLCIVSDFLVVRKKVRRKRWNIVVVRHKNPSLFFTPSTRWRGALRVIFNLCHSASLELVSGVAWDSDQLVGRFCPKLQPRVLVCVLRSRHATPQNHRALLTECTFRLRGRGASWLNKSWPEGAADRTGLRSEMKHYIRNDSRKAQQQSGEIDHLPPPDLDGNTRRSRGRVNVTVQHAVKPNVCQPTRDTQWQLTCMQGRSEGYYLSVNYVMRDGDERS